MTIHKAKGREFEGAVLLLEDDPTAHWRVSGSRDPDIVAVTDLYRVATSRAREALEVVAFDDIAGDALPPVQTLLGQ